MSSITENLKPAWPLGRLSEGKVFFSFADLNQCSNSFLFSPCKHGTRDLTGAIAVTSLDPAVKVRPHLGHLSNSSAI